MDRKKGIAAALALITLWSGCVMRPAAEPERPPEPAPPAEAEETMEERDPVREYMEGLTLRQMVGQLFFVRPDALIPGKTQAEIDGSHDPEPVTEVSDALRGTLLAYPVGGVALFGKNIRTPGQLTRLAAELQSASAVPLLLGVDEEGGAVARLANTPSLGLKRYGSPASVGRGGAAAAGEMGHTIGRYLRQYGFSVDFAPVADVNTNPSNPIIGSRAFSGDPEAAAIMAGAMAEGLWQEGVLPTFKHFPGHGDTAEDSHDGIAVCRKTREELEACEWVPYLRNDLTHRAVMVGHIALPAVTGDDTPATLSPAVVTGCLREQLGFDGLVFTDSMGMHAITDHYPPGEAAVLALKAGVDVILTPRDLAGSFEAVVDAVENGDLSRERLSESVYRVLRCKYELGLL